MIIPNWLAITVFISIAIIVGILYFHEHAGTDNGNAKFGYLLSVLVASGVIALCSIPIKTLVIVEDCSNSHIPSHKTVYFYGSPKIKVSYGEIDTRRIGVKDGEKYLFNLSSNPIRLYPVVYEYHSLFQENALNKETKTYFDETYINPYECVLIQNVPKYWFTMPPKELDPASNNYHKASRIMFGEKEVSWCLNI